MMNKSNLLINLVVRRRTRFVNRQCSLFALNSIPSQHCYSSSSATSSSSSEKSSDYSQLCDALVGSEIGSIDADAWVNAQILLKHCVHSGEDGLDRSFQILERLSKEEKQDHFLNMKSPLNFVIAGWHKRFTTHRASVSMSPRQVFDIVKAWQSNPILRPDTTTYAMILSATSHYSHIDPNGSPALADSILQFMLEESHHSTSIRPNVACFGAVMNTWVQSGNQNAPQKIQDWIKCMSTLHEEGWPEMQPNTIVYNILLKACARSNELEKAESILQDMLESKILVSPDNISFTTLLSAYSNRGSTDAAEKAERLLAQMHQLYNAGLEFAKPSVVAYTTVMEAHSRAGQAHQAEQLLRDLEAQFHATEDPDWMPDETAYNTVILAWAKKMEPLRADSLLQDMYESGYVNPNERSFQAVLTSWAKAGAPEKAEMLLTRMHELFVAGEVDARPTVGTYNIVLDSWAKSRRKDAWKRAEDILAHMEKIAQAGDENVKPNLRTWNTVVNCAAKGGRANRALEIVESLSAACDSDAESKPNIRTWNTVLAACLKSKDVRSAKQVWGRMRAHRIRPDIVSYNTVFSIYARCRAKTRQHRQTLSKEIDALIHQIKGDGSVTPNRITYLAIVDGWLNLGNVERAEEYLNDECMQSAADSSILPPDSGLYNKILSALAEQKSPKKAEALLLKMADLHRRYGFEALRPSVDTYNRILNAWAKSGAVNCGERADQVLRQMQQLALAGESQVAPDIVSYNSVMKAWSTSGSPIAASNVEHLVLEMILKGDPTLLPDHVSYGTWLKTIEMSDEDDKGRRAREVLKTMRIHNLEPSQFLSRKVRSLEESDP